MSESVRFPLGLVDILALLIALTLIIFQPSFGGDPGVGWHLRTGEWIWAQFAVPHHDPFLATLSASAGGASSAGTSWVANQWLADLFLWGVYSIGGWELLHLWVVVTGLLAFVVIPALTARQEGVGDLSCFFAALAVAAVGSVQWILRPVLFSFLLTSLLVWLTSRVRLELERDASTLPALAYAFPVLFFLWANLHSAFPLGLLLLGFFQLELLRRYWNCSRRVVMQLFILTLLSALVTLLNPYGWELHRNILSLVGDSYFMKLNQEWLPPLLADRFFWPFFAALFTVSLLAIRQRTKLFQVEQLVCLMLFGVLALSSRRYIPFFGVLAFLPIARALQSSMGHLSFSVLGSSLARFTIITCAFISLYSTAFAKLPGRTLPTGIDGFYPTRLVDRIAAAEASAPPDSFVFNHPDLGGYLIWRLTPQRLAFIDDRNELNGREKYQQFFKIVELESDWKEDLARLNPRWLLIRNSSPLAKGQEENLPNYEFVDKEGDYALFLLQN